MLRMVDITPTLHQRGRKPSPVIYRGRPQLDDRHIWDSTRKRLPSGNNMVHKSKYRFPLLYLMFKQPPLRVSIYGQ